MTGKCYNSLLFACYCFKVRFNRRFVLTGYVPIVCLALQVTVSALCGCSKETPQKREPALQPVNSPVSSSITKQTQKGEALFKQYCFSCHPDGGNVSDPKRALYGSVLRSNHISKPEDIVRIMRNPISRMIRFDANTLSDKDAQAIAEFVLQTY